MRRFSRRFRRRGIVVLVALAVALATAVAKGLRRSGRRGPAPSRGAVRRVVDGDTFDLTNGARIRLLDIDAPEFDGAETRFAQRATEALGELLGGASSGRVVRATSLTRPGRVVTLEYGPRVRDRYGRFLAYVFTDDAAGEGAEPMFVNFELVRRGLARAYAGGGHGPRYDEILAAERGARSAGRGMWATNSSR